MAVAQLVEHMPVEHVVAGSIPVGHPQTTTFKNILFLHSSCVNLILTGLFNHPELQSSKLTIRIKSMLKYFFLIIALIIVFIGIAYLQINKITARNVQTDNTTSIIPTHTPSPASSMNEQCEMYPLTSYTVTPNQVTLNSNISIKGTNQDKQIIIDRSKNEITQVDNNNTVRINDIYSPIKLVVYESRYEFTMQGWDNDNIQLRKKTEAIYGTTECVLNLPVSAH